MMISRADVDFVDMLVDCERSVELGLLQRSQVVATLCVFAVIKTTILYFGFLENVVWF